MNHVLATGSVRGLVLVTGASGYVGSRLVRALCERGVRVRAMGRDPEKLQHLRALGAEVVGADVHDRSSLRHALRDVQIAYYLVHSMGAGMSEQAFIEYDRFGAQNFALEGRDLEQIIYLGGLGNEDDALSPHLRSRAEVGRILMQGRAPATVLRAGVILGGKSASFVMLRALVERLPVMICPRWVETRAQPIAANDVIEYLAASLGHPQTLGQMLEIGGPEILTYRQMMDRTARLMGRRHVIISVPVLTPRLSAYWVDFITPVAGPLAHALIEGLRNEVIVNDPTARALLPVQLTPFDEAVRAALRESH